jgi:nucleotide-binding universal stress UspA family protein
VADSRDSLTTKAQAIVQRAKAAAVDATFLVWEGEPGEAIVAAATAESADLIVVGSHGRSGVSRFFIGSVSDFVVRHAHCPVMVVRGRVESVRR